jgi:hypothetical protein
VGDQDDAEERADRFLNATFGGPGVEGPRIAMHNALAALLRTYAAEQVAAAEARGRAEEREAITRHAIDHREWCLEPGRMPRDERSASCSALNVVIRFCEERRGEKGGG